MDQVLALIMEKLCLYGMPDVKESTHITALFLVWRNQEGLIICYKKVIKRWWVVVLACVGAAVKLPC